MVDHFQEKSKTPSMKNEESIKRGKLEYLKKVERSDFVEIDLTNSPTNTSLNLKGKDVSNSTLNDETILSLNNEIWPLQKSVASFDDAKLQVSGKLVVRNIKISSKSHKRIQSVVDTRKLGLFDFRLSDDAKSRRQDSNLKESKGESDFSQMKSTSNIANIEKNTNIKTELEIPNFETSSSQKSIFASKEKLTSSVKADLVSKRGGIGLTMNDRPEGLPPKSKDELESHMKLYEDIVKNNLAMLEKETKDITNHLINTNTKEARLNKESIFWNNIVNNWTCKTISQRQFRKKYVEGLPTYIRGKIWKLFSRDKISVATEVFDELFRQPYDNDSISSEIYHSIEMDVERTFPDLKLFQKNHLMHHDLCSLLFSFHVYNSHLGYTQGMSYPMSIFTLNLEPFDAFVCFNNFVNTPLFTSLYSCNSFKLEQIYVWFETFLAMENPKLVNHIHSINLSPSLYLLDWLMSGFSKIFSLEVVSRIFDVYFLEGTLFFVKCAMMLMLFHQDELFQNDDPIFCAQLLTTPLTNLTEKTVFSLILRVTNYQDYYDQLERTLKFS